MGDSVASLAKNYSLRISLYTDCRDHATDSGSVHLHVMILEFWTFRIKDPFQPSGPKSSTNIWVILFPNIFNNFADIFYIYIYRIYIEYIYINIRTP